MTDFVTKDSGERRQFNTGAQRDVVTDKGRYDLISPIMIERLAKLLQRGAEKYNDRNWEKGMPLSVRIYGFGDEALVQVPRRTQR